MLLLIMVALLRTPAAEGSVYMLSDSRLNATFRGTPADLGTLSSLATVGTGRPAQNVIAAGMGPHPLWSASFVGSGLGEASISSANASCAGTSVMLGHANLSVLTFRWIGCAVELPSATAATADGQTATWIEHARSTCGGACLAEKSKAGNCDRLPGCGHHPWGGSANCSVPAMQARCLGATGCTAFNTNGYLYHGTSVLPFAAYALQCYTLAGPPLPPRPPPPKPPPPGPSALVNVSVTVTLSEGHLEYEIAFDGDGTVSLWEYVMSLPNVAVTPSTKDVQPAAAGQLLGFYDDDDRGGGGGGGGSGGNGSDAVYFAAHDPARATKSCAAVFNLHPAVPVQ